MPEDSLPEISRTAVDRYVIDQTQITDSFRVRVQPPDDEANRYRMLASDQGPATFFGRPVNDLFQMDAVELTCEATVAGERIKVMQRIAVPVWDDPYARRACEQNLRAQLLQKIMEKWKPVITIRR